MFIYTRLYCYSYIFTYTYLCICKYIRCCILFVVVILYVIMLFSVIKEMPKKDFTLLHLKVEIRLINIIYKSLHMQEDVGKVIKINIINKLIVSSNTISFKSTPCTGCCYIGIKSQPCRNASCCLFNKREHFYPITK